MRAIYVHCTSAPSFSARKATHKQVIKLEQVLMPEAVCCCLQTCFYIRVNCVPVSGQTCKCGFGIVYQCTKSHSQEQVFLPEAICCCLHVVLTLE